ncbi:MAG TPA: site-2 protease family protein, partial [Candidatus Polarisedimenticolia bacterium]|nr:site-2 protease family protein [Candidatus Polarisedimenticolia bacterium]
GGTAWILGAVAALLLFASVLVHELSHALLAQRAGIAVPRIRLFLFGGVSEMEAEPREPRVELRVAAAGPLTSLALAALFWLAARLPVWDAVPGGTAVVTYLATINLALGIFNLLPGFPLDGGRILRAWLWSRHGDVLAATRTAGRVGSFLGYGLMGFGFIRLFGDHMLDGIWMILIGMFLNQAAGMSYKTLLLKNLLAGVRVRQLMSQPVVSVPEHASLEELVGDYFYRHPHGSLPVANDDRLVGMVSVEQLKGVPRDEWIRTPVRSVMTPVSAIHPLGPDEDCVSVLERMMREGVGRLPVVVEGRIVGILSRRDVMQLFKIRSDLAA